MFVIRIIAIIKIYYHFNLVIQVNFRKTWIHENSVLCNILCVVQIKLYQSTYIYHRRSMFWSCQTNFERYVPKRLTISPCFFIKYPKGCNSRRMVLLVFICGRHREGRTCLWRVVCPNLQVSKFYLSKSETKMYPSTYNILGDRLWYNVFVIFPTDNITLFIIVALVPDNNNKCILESEYIIRL